jgi:hypothetical protein
MIQRLIESQFRGITEITLKVDFGTIVESEVSARAIHRVNHLCQSR